MNQKIYETMKFSGTLSMVLGIVLMSIAIPIAVLNIINGGLLLKQKSHITF